HDGDDYIWRNLRDDHVHSALNVPKAVDAAATTSVLTPPYRAKQPLQPQEIALTCRLGSHIPSGCCHFAGRRALRIRLEVGECTQVKVGKHRAPASGALHIQPQPLVDALNMEVVSTRQASDLHECKFSNLRLALEQKFNKQNTACILMMFNTNAAKGKC
ncbi:hypothetical protein BHM03_00009143, partial [Ensete ventricosum]